MKEKVFTWITALTSVEIKDGKLYLTVDVDNYGDNEGKTFILEQDINEDTADTEWWRL